MDRILASNSAFAGSGDLKEHGLFRSAVLHLAPGVLILLLYLFVFNPLSVGLGLPRQLGFVLKVALVLLPVQLGYLIYLGRRRNGRFTLEGVVLNRRKLPARQLAPLVLGLFLWALVVLALLSRIDDFLLERLFYWVPASLLPEAGAGRYPQAALIGTHVASVVAIGLAAPIVEELYYRGFLLPRLSRLGAWAPIWNTVLFNVYHFWSPWRLVTRTIFTLPMVYAVWRKQSISIGIWWHCLGNVLGELVAFSAILQATEGF